MAVAPTGGAWSAGAGQDTAVNRAMQYLGWSYAWAGGNRNGPTRGIAVDFASRNDGGVIGFDCSGLTFYGWAPYLSMPHYARVPVRRGRSVPPLTRTVHAG